MSTRSIIAIGTPDKWHGVYVHYDGYPSVTGRCIWAGVHMHTGTIAERIATLAADWIDGNPEGWSYLPDETISDVSLKYQDRAGQRCLTGDMRYSGGPMPGNRIEYVYILDATTGQMHVGNDERIIASVDLDGDEPDWTKIAG